MKKGVIQNPNLFRQPKDRKEPSVEERFKLQLQQIAKVDSSKNFLAVPGYN